MQRRKREGLLKAAPPAAPSTFEEIERRFEDFFRRPFSVMGLPWWPGVAMPASREIVPSVDIYEEEGDVVVKAELPGMKKEEISIDLTEDTVSLSGEKKKEERVERKGYCRIERSYGSFARSYSLPAPVQTDKAKARYHDGILEIRIPKTEEAKKKSRTVAIE